MHTPETKTDLKTLLAQQAQLDKQIAEQRSAEKAAVLADVRKTIADFGLTVDELFSSAKMRKKAAIKFKDPVSGATWSGRGRTPKWFNAANPEKFAV